MRSRQCLFGDIRVFAEEDPHQEWELESEWMNGAIRVYLAG